jgi:hypothetical protein
MPFERLPEPWTFFVDRCLGTGDVPTGLRTLVDPDRHKVVVHDDEFPQDTKDVVWLPLVGEKRWVLITKDIAMRSNPLEIAAIIHSGVATFALPAGGQTAAKNVAAIKTAWRAMQRCLRRFAPPFIATITISGEVTVIHDQNGRLAKPKRLKGGA